MRLVQAWLVITVLTVGAHVAAAECAPPSPVLSPPSGTVLADKASVYLFLPEFLWALEDGASSPNNQLEILGARFVAREVAKAPMYRVMRIDLEATGSMVTVRWSGPPSAWETSYRVGVPAANHAAVASVSHHSSAWTCSHNNVIDVALTGTAVAYRVAWSDNTSTLLAPDFEREPHVGPGHVISLGHVGCRGDTVDPIALSRPRALHLVALFSDGTERSLGRAMVQLDSARNSPDAPVLPSALVITPAPRSPQLRLL